MVVSQLWLLVSSHIIRISMSTPVQTSIKTMLLDFFIRAVMEFSEKYVAFQYDSFSNDVIKIIHHEEGNKYSFWTEEIHNEDHTFALCPQATFLGK